MRYTRAVPARANQITEAVAIANIDRPLNKPPFGRFMPENDSMRYKPRCEAHSMQRILDAWKMFEINSNLATAESFRLDDVYSKALDAVSGINCSAKDVEAFMVGILPEELMDGAGKNRFIGLAAGIFISALVNSGSADAYTLQTRHLYPLPWALGCHNEKDVLVLGNVGLSAGVGMKAGSLTIRGHADDLIGSHLGGGKIIVEGNAGVFVGGCMRDGEIHIIGKCTSIGKDITGGKIFAGGVQVYPTQKQEPGLRWWERFIRWLEQ